jgi:hypothetical protein
MYLVVTFCCCPLHRSPILHTGETQYSSFDIVSPVAILSTEMIINLILKKEVSSLLGYKRQFLEP